MALISSIILVLITVTATAGVAILASQSTSLPEDRIYELLILPDGGMGRAVIGDVIIVEVECVGPYDGYITIDLSLVFKADLRDVRIRVYAGYEEKTFTEPVVRRGVQLHYSWSQWGDCPPVVVAVEAFGGRG